MFQKNAPIQNIVENLTVMSRFHHDFRLDDFLARITSNGGRRSQGRQPLLGVAELVQLQSEFVHQRQVQAAHLTIWIVHVV